MDKFDDKIEMVLNCPESFYSLSSGEKVAVMLALGTWHSSRMGTDVIAELERFSTEELQSIVSWYRAHKNPSDKISRFQLWAHEWSQCRV